MMRARRAESEMTEVSRSGAQRWLVGARILAGSTLVFERKRVRVRELMFRRRKGTVKGGKRAAMLLRREIRLK
jgi:hypothetical protein